MITLAKLKDLENTKFKKLHSAVEDYHNIVDYFFDWSRQWEYPWLLKNVPFNKKKTVLDAGGGTCYFPDIVDYYVKSVTILDRDKSFIKKGKGEVHDFIKQDLSEELTTTEQFDIVLCVSVLEHIPDYLSAIQRLVPLVKSGGYLAMTLDMFLDNSKPCRKADIPAIVKMLEKDFDLGDVDLSEDKLYSKLTLQEMKCDMPNLYSKNYKDRTILGIIVKKK